MFHAGVTTAWSRTSAARPEMRGKESVLCNEDNYVSIFQPCMLLVALLFSVCSGPIISFIKCIANHNKFI